MTRAALATLALAGLAVVPPAGRAQEPPASPRLRALVEPGAAGPAVAAFWAEVASAGAPLVERRPDHPARCLVTFLWRAEGPFREVVAAGPALGGDPAPNRLRRLGATDVWYATRDLPCDLRTVYRLAVDPPPGTTGGRDHARRDPLNPREFVYPADPDVPGSTDYRISLLELPDAAPQPWVAPRAGVPGGELALHRVTSRVLGNTRRVWTWLPPGATGRGPLPLVVVFDGAAYLGMVPTPVVLANLVAAGRLPPVAAVLVDNPDQATRSRELDCHAPFATFLATELLPWVRARLPVTTDPARVVLAGSSGGGQAAICAALRHPELFGNVLAQSGSFFARPDEPIGDEWVYRHLATGPRLPLRVYLDVGRFEPVFAVTAVRVLRNVLEARGYPLTYAEFSGGHDYAWWRGTLADGLVALLGTP
jgi:enterochelin esterase-like enzyme